MHIINLIFNSQHSAEWFGSIATLMAVIVSLYISLKKPKLKITYEVNYTKFIGNSKNLNVTFYVLNKKSHGFIKLNSINLLHNERVEVFKVNEKIDELRSFLNNEDSFFIENLFKLKHIGYNDSPIFKLQNNEVNKLYGDIYIIILNAIKELEYNNKNELDLYIENYSIQYTFEKLEENKTSFININLPIKNLYKNNAIQRIENLDVIENILINRKKELNNQE